MKALFFSGKGGVGKSTLSAVTAWQLAERGSRVLAVSLDPAHNLGDIYGRKLGDKPLRLNSRLSLREVSLERAAKLYVRQNEELLRELYGYLKPLNFDRYFSLLRYSPGVEEYAALIALERQLADAADLDYIVFDTPPTGLTLRILALPRLTLGWLERLAGLRRAILDKRHTIHNLTGRFDPEGTHLPWRESDDPVMRKLGELRDRYERMAGKLRAEGSGVALVFNPDCLSLTESRRLLEGLRDLELPVRILFHNKIEPEQEHEAGSFERELTGGDPPDMPVVRISAARRVHQGPAGFGQDLASAVEKATGHG
jgi:arsenite-transporting ATPase